MALSYFSEQVTVILGFEWERANQAEINDYSKRPHIDLVALIILLPHKLRCHVAWSPTEYFLFLKLTIWLLGEGRKPKVYDLDLVRIFLYQNIIKFDVSVGDSKRV